MRIQEQIRFLRTIDGLKNVQRRNLLHDGSRRENSAEHSWHLALAVVLLGEHSLEPFDRERALGLALVHDLVELYADDTFVYDTQAMATKAERERLAADKLFSLLPEDQREFFRNLWEEYEEGDSAEARFVGALDRLLPVLANGSTAGASWKQHGVAYEQVISKNAPMEKIAPAVWECVKDVIDTVFEKKA